MKRQPDEVDWALMRALSADGRMTVRALARMVGMSEPSVHDRLGRLERDGVITGYHAEVAPHAVEAGTAAFVALRFDPGPVAKAGVNAALHAEGCVLEVYEVAGEDCYWIKVRLASPQALAEALDRIRAVPFVTSTRTTVVLRTILERHLLATDESAVRELVIDVGSSARVADADGGEHREGGEERKEQRPGRRRTRSPQHPLRSSR